MLILNTKYVYQLKLLNLTSDTILQNRKYGFYFDNYIGALYKIHIVINVSVEKRKPYQYQKS